MVFDRPLFIGREAMVVPKGKNVLRDLPQSTNFRAWALHRSELDALKLERYPGLRSCDQVHICRVSQTMLAFSLSLLNSNIAQIRRHLLAVLLLASCWSS